jgi:hypothetical protein
VVDGRIQVYPDSKKGVNKVQESFAKAYNYAFDYYEDLPRNDLEKEIEEMTAEQKQGKTESWHTATLFAARDQHHARFRGRPRDAVRDALTRQAGG